MTRRTARAMGPAAKEDIKGHMVYSLQSEAQIARRKAPKRKSACKHVRLCPQLLLAVVHRPPFVHKTYCRC